MRILRAADHKVMPWKNGGGSTTEIAVAPAGAGLGDFDWRVSMAGVVEDGAFSRFPGIDRTLAVIEGAGIELVTAGREPARLTLESAPFAFDGAAQTSARLIDGPILDLNVMTRRGRFAHEVRRLASGEEVTTRGEASLVLSRMDGQEILVDGSPVRLDMNDAALFEEAGRRLTLRPGPGGAFFVVHFTAASAAI
ncbi:HutD family protein [Bosea sp. 117]|uniref:HutD/Ves family protein n=1 Tax=Bosea sp. 117 TaxID=1125973 RepID=UPI000494108E|nr:HutD family protein [Bosea sp. 117]